MTEGLMFPLLQTIHLPAESSTECTRGINHVGAHFTHSPSMPVEMAQWSTTSRLVRTSQGNYSDHLDRGNITVGSLSGSLETELFQQRTLCNFRRISEENYNL